MSTLAKLKTLELDVEKKILKVNGIDFSNVDRLTLSFIDGTFSLSVNQRYFANGNKVSRSGDETADE